MNMQLKQKVQLPRLNKPIIVLALGVLTLLGLRALHVHQYLTFPQVILDTLHTATIIVGAYLGASVFLKLTVRWFSRVLDENAEIEHKLILSKFYLGLVYIFTTFLVLWSLGLTAQNITIFLGLIATGIAFAVREVILSYIVWFVLLTKRPFRIGDYIRIGEDEGRVQHVGTFYVVLDETPDTREDYIRVPNKIFIEKPVYNYGRESVQCTVRIPIDTVPLDFSERLTDAKQQLGSEVNVRLENRADKLFVRADTYTSQKQLHFRRDEMLRLLTAVTRGVAKQK